jgi:hypothetical protein
MMVEPVKGREGRRKEERREGGRGRGKRTHQK